MTPPTTGTTHPREHLRAALALGAGIALSLGVLRGIAQMVAQQAYARPFRMVAIMALTSAIWLIVPLMVDRLLTARVGSSRRWATLIVFAVVFSAIEPLWFFGLLARVANWHERGGYWINGLLRLDTNLLILGAVVGWLWLREVNRRREAAAERAASLRARASSAELDVLTMQLQPHFLFNTLNLVSQLAFESTARARRAIGNLRRLLLESVASNGEATVSLADELRLLEAYLDLQRDRFGDRLDARVVADVDLLEARVPRMLLQPVVENAIRHGISPRKSGGQIHVRVRRAPGARVSIEVSDDGLGLRDDVTREGIGLANVRHRLEQLHAGATMVDLRNRQGGGAITCLEFPFDARRIVDATETIESPSDDDDGSILNPGRWARAIVMVLGWILIAGIWAELEAMSVSASQGMVPWTEILVRYALNAGVWIALTPLALLLADRSCSERARRRIIVHALGAVAFGSVHLWAWGTLMRAVQHSSEMTIHSFRSSWAVWDLVAYVVLVAIGETLAARARLHEQRVEASHARARLASARVSMLRLHLQPSLLLSAIDAIDAAIGDPVRCETAITRLGDVLRSLLATTAQEETALRDELALLDSYAAVVGRRLTIAVADPSDLDALVPAVILCSLAVSAQGEAWRVGVARRGARLAIELAIDGAVALHDDALSTTERRLSAIYEREHAVRLVRRDEYASVVIELPRRLASAATPRPSSVYDERAIA